MVPKIFISYRRADSQDFTDRLFEHMERHFGADNVFQDVGDSSKIPPGVDFVEYLAAQVEACDVVLVVIGEHWTRILQERVQRDDDFVRIEVESGLQQGKIVIPVLKSDTPMPSSTELPGSIQKLARRNASRVRPNPDFVRDCDTLADGIRAVFAMRKTKSPSAFAETASTPEPTRFRSVNLMPGPFDWMDIPSGNVTLITRKGWVNNYIPEGGSRMFEVPRFHISKYPVTNAQYAKFIDAGGYRTKRWWTSEGWQRRHEGWVYEAEWKPSWIPWSEPRNWQDSNWNGADQPVVGVSWFEAVAFCLWLSDVTGEKIMLPTEQQWQRAAQGDDGRDYPWEGPWDCKRCNNSVIPCETSCTTQVRQYEGHGDSPFGVVDMAGNVWEWCLTDYVQGAQDIHNSATYRVLRGGPWNFNRTDYFRCAFRYWLNPHLGGNNRGFRLSLAAT